MPNYQNSKVYSIRSLSRPELIYVGSTTQTLSQRMVKHRKASSTCASKEIITIGDAYIELIENYPCNDKNELLARENRYIRGLDCLNKQLALNDCPHGRKHNECVECHGRGICVHNKHKKACIPCHGSEICEHKRRKTCCKDCRGSQLCEHQVRTIYCKICSPIECDVCNNTHSKGHYKRHLKSKKHLENISEIL